MLNPAIIGKEEIPLLCNDPRVIDYDGLEQWQIEHLMSCEGNDSISQANSNLQRTDKIVAEWLKSLTKEDWLKIKRHRSLFGIHIPEDWIKVWRLILKEPALRDSKRATRGGKAIGSYGHLWNIWSEDCIRKYLNDMEKELLQMVDEGLMYEEIGEKMLYHYGDDFWKQRKEVTKTTPKQVVNNYMHWRMPNKIVRSELTEIVLNKIDSLAELKRERERKQIIEI